MSTAAPVFDIEAFLRRERSLAQAALARALEDARARLAAPLVRAIEHSARAPGKLLRPILCSTAYRAVGGRHEGIYDLAVAVELIHTYSLMHDDLPCMDDAELRRGQPAAHRVFGERATMVAGAALIPLGMLHAWQGALRVGCEASVARRIVGELAAGAGAAGMVGGQVLDLQPDGKPLDEDGLDALHARKTGALLTASLRMGGIAAGAGEAVLDALEAYGRSVGLAFQVVDDILDVTASAHALGKAPLRDAELGKVTYASMHGVEGARRRADQLVRGAIAALARAGVEAPALEALARYVVERDR